MSWGWVARVIGLAACGLSAACTFTPTAPTEDATIVIGSIGVVPAEVRIEAWGRVNFVNNDTRPHTIASDPIDIHTDCPPVNQIGLLNPGDSRTTGTLNLERTCGFHDHTNQSDSSLRGRIIVQ